MTVETFMDGKGDDAREVKRVKFKLADKRGALVELGRHHGIFKDKQELEHGGKVALEVRWREPGELGSPDVADDHHGRRK